MTDPRSSQNNLPVMVTRRGASPGGGGRCQCRGAGPGTKEMLSSLRVHSIPGELSPQSNSIKDLSYLPNINLKLAFDLSSFVTQETKLDSGKRCPVWY